MNSGLVVERAGPEAAVLMQCVQATGDAERVETLNKLLQQEIDWDALIEAATSHEVFPFLHWHLVPAYAGIMPAVTLERLQRSFHASVCRSLVLARELYRLLRLFADEDIPAMPFKGPALAAHVYEVSLLRPCSDLDILVRNRDVSRAKRLLLSRDYDCDWPVLAWQEATALRSPAANDFSFVRRNPSILLELHWHVVARRAQFALDVDSMFEHAGTVVLNDVRVLIPRPEELLLILIVHAAKHCFESLKWIVDIDRVVRAHPQLDWDRLLSLARNLGTERFLRLGVFLAHDLLDTQVPYEALQQILTDPSVRALAGKVYDQLFSTPPRHRSMPAKAIFVSRARERWKDRILYNLGIVSPTGEDFKAFALPEGLSFFYYAFRPFRLIGKYGLRPLMERQARTGD